MYRRGVAPMPAALREIANPLLAQQGETPIRAVGENRVYTLVKCHYELKTQLSRRCNHDQVILPFVC